jgi:hypothetical protein
VNRLALGVRGGRRQQNPSASATAATRPFTPRLPTCYYGPLAAEVPAAEVPAAEVPAAVIPAAVISSGSEEGVGR